MSRAVGVLLLALCLFFAGTYWYNERQINNEPEIIGDFSISVSTSPNKVNIVEIKEMYKEFTDAKEGTTEPAFHSLRIYYGEYGSVLDKYKELEVNDVQAIDYFDFHWKDDEHVTVQVFSRNEQGKSYISQSVKYNLSN
ncbi:hypothetical protein CU633_07790 [Bacillus sp. V3-13]|uniref:hypothetical protein n=1 Tax=Bacillus sp. V3-13 TaxID=2053728 RepID=UPI000C77F220|nr:hypothetical protein [Bacillus sp. V3-13]PLR77999.1 hypothetical protein CU633_07790 [Bacillus sp. V3-13]